MRNIWEWERVTDRDNSHNQKPWILQHNCPQFDQKTGMFNQDLNLNVRNFYKKNFCTLIVLLLWYDFGLLGDFNFSDLKISAFWQYFCKTQSCRDQVQAKNPLQHGYWFSLKQKGAHEIWLNSLYSFSGSDSSDFLASEASVSADSSLTVKSATPGAVPFPVPLAIPFPFPLDSGFFSEV